MSLTPRTSPLNPGAAFLAALALLLGLFAFAAVDADAAKPKKRAPAVKAKVAKKTLTITGTKRRDVIVLRLKRRARRTLEVDTRGNSRPEFRFARGRFTKIVVKGGNGNDVLRIDDARGVFTDTEKTTLKGDAGHDQIAGGAGAESISGGTGNDGVDTGAGNDSAVLGAGDDTLRSDPDDGGDRVQGDAGSDRLVVMGSPCDDNLSAAAAGARARIARGDATAVDADDVEAAQFSLLGGADAIAIGDLSGSDLAQTSLDLGAALGAPGDSAPDRVIVNGSAGADNISVSGTDAAFAVGGLTSNVSAAHVEPGADRLTINGQEGGDTIAAGGLAPSAVPLDADGGPGADSIAGGGSAKLLTGGADDDTFSWNAGDAPVRVEGQAGNDRIAVAGTDGND
jgi:Ca2+-binding RTX toxin-like protein